MRVIAAALVVMVPCASLAHGLGPSEDAPMATPSARLLPQQTEPSMDVARAVAGPVYKSVVFWVALSAFVVAVGAVAAAIGASLSMPQPYNGPYPAGCPTCLGK
jgi:hypothetical protein